MVLACLSVDYITDTPRLRSACGCAAIFLAYPTAVVCFSSRGKLDDQGRLHAIMFPSRQIAIFTITKGWFFLQPTSLF